MKTRVIQRFFLLFVYGLLCSALPDFTGRDGWTLYLGLAMFAVISYAFFDALFGSAEQDAE